MTILTGNETLYVLGQTPLHVPAAETFQITTQDIADLGANALPPQSGHEGDVLGTDGTDPVWINPGYQLFQGDNTGVTNVGAALQAEALANDGYVYLGKGIYYVGTTIDPGTLGGSLKLIGVGAAREDIVIMYDPAVSPIDFNSGASGTVFPQIFNADASQSLVATTFALTAATQANPGVMTTSGAHTLQQGDYVKITGVVGMTELNNNVYRVGITTSTTFQILNVNGVYIDTSGFTAYVSGGTVTRYIAFVPLQLNGQDFLYRVDVADASLYAPCDVVQIHSQDIIPSGSSRRAGEAGTVVWVDYQSNQIFLQTRPYQAMIYFTSPVINLYRQDQEVLIENVTFTARGNYMDPQYSTRLPAVNVWGVPFATVRNCYFNETWGQAVVLRGCPYQLYENNKCNRLPNNLAFNPAATIRTITSATQANPVVITTSANHGFNNTQTVYVGNNVGGMTQIRNTVFVVANKTNTTFELQSLNTENIDGTAYSPFTAGGSVSLAILVEALGYGLSVYGASHGAIARDCEFRQCRHAVTTDGAGDASYTTTECYKYGQPTDVTFENLTAHDSWGIPFDTHEEGYNIIFRNCRSYWPSRGAAGGTYDGMGFQIRCATSIIENCGTRGGFNGVIYRAVDHPFTPVHLLTDFNVVNTNSAQSGVVSVNQDNGILMEDYSALTYPPAITIVDPQFTNVGKCITTGKKATVNLQGGYFANNDIVIDAVAGAKIRAYGTMTCDYSNQTRTSTNNRVALVRSDAPNGGASILLDKIHVIRGVTTNQPVCVFQQQDTTANKTYDYNEIIDDNPGSLAALVVVSSGSTTMLRASTINKTLTTTSKTVTAGTYTVLQSDAGQTLLMNSGSGQTVTVPATLPASFSCSLIQMGAGQTTFAAASGATLVNVDSQTKAQGQYARTALTCMTNADAASAAVVLSGATGT